MEYKVVVAVGLLASGCFGTAWAAGESKATLEVFAPPSVRTEREAQAAMPADLPVADMPSRSKKAVQSMKEMVAKMAALLEEGRKEKDIVKINAVNEKLTAGKTLLRIGEQSEMAMTASLAKKDLDSVRHEYTKISIAYKKMAILRDEADAVAGNTTWYPGETTLEVEDGTKDSTGNAATVGTGKGAASTQPGDDVVASAPTTPSGPSPNDPQPMVSPTKPPKASPYQ